MIDARTPAERSAALRQKGEALLPPGEGRVSEQLSLEASNALIHELRVHQVELEMQNEELRQTMVALEASRERYFELYDLAPVGYLTLSEKGIIREANLAAASLLGETRRALARQPLSRFFLPEDMGTYFQQRQRLRDTGQPQGCDLQLLTKGGAVSWVRLETTLAVDAGGAPVIRAAMSDLSRPKAVERLLRDRTAKLERTLDKMALMVGLLPICARCKNIRDEQQRWQELEAFLAQHAAREPNRLLCPDCLHKLEQQAPDADEPR